VTDWESVKRFVEPVVAEIDQPEATLLELSVVLHGDGQEAVRWTFSYDGQTPERDRRLLEHAIAVVRDAMERRRDNEQ
jgi:hypothetical protein